MNRYGILALPIGIVLIVVGVIVLFNNDSDSSEPAQGQPPEESSESVFATSNPLGLPVREGEKRLTSGIVPHIQFGAEPVPEVDAELRRRAFLFPGVEDLASDRSLPGARGIAFSDGFELARPDVISGSREFAHIHPDGSLHVWMPVDSAYEVHEKKWGEIHPFVGRSDFWDGVVMVFTPETDEELDVVMQILVDAYNLVAGAELTLADVN